MIKVITKLGLVALVAGLAACQPGASPQPVDMSGLFRTNNQNNNANNSIARAQAVGAVANPNTSPSALQDAARAASGPNTNLSTAPVATTAAIENIREQAQDAFNNLNQ